MRRARAPCTRRRRRRRVDRTRADPLGRRRLFSDQAYDPRWWRQLDDPVLEQLETGGARRQSRRPLGAGAARPGARGLRRGSPAALSDGHGRRLRGRPRAGAARDSATSRCASTPTAPASTRPGSSISSAASARRSRAASANAESFEAALAERARQRRRRGGAELLRAARHPAAAVGARSQPGQPARDAAADRRCGATPGIGEEQDVASASARVVGDRGGGCRRCAPRWRRANIGWRC